MPLMAKYLFTNVAGSFVLDEDLRIADSILFKEAEDYLYKAHAESELRKKHPLLQRLPEECIPKAMAAFKDNRFYNVFYRINLVLAKQKVREAVSDDLLIAHAVNNITDIEKVVNILVKRLRDWYSVYNPEASEAIESHEKFVDIIIEKSKDELLSELGIKKEYSMGKEISKKDIEPIISLGKEIRMLYILKNSQEEYLEAAMRRLCPNMTEVAGALIGAKLINEAGSIRHLATMPSTTIQLLGAERALFRHMRNKKNLPPKFGLIFNHPFIQRNMRQSGKAARAFADKISIAVRVDYFRGTFIGDKLKAGLEGKFR